MNQYLYQQPPIRTPQSMCGLAADAPVLLALSGGADSVTLLHLLTEMQKVHPFPLLAAHVNHGIRGAQAIRDRAFCKALAERCGVEICILDADVPQLAAESGRGLEDMAREVRYAFFADLMQARNIPILVTAHHADDHLETVLFHMARGSGSRGLCGIAPTRPFANGYLVRPMLSWKRDDILCYCSTHALEYVTDSTNADTAYTRNRLRAEVIPVLKDMFPQLHAHTLELSRHLAEDEACLSDMASDFLKTHGTENGIPLSPLKTLSPAIAKRVLLQWTFPVCGTLESVHLKELMRLISGETPNACVALPKGACAVDRCGVLTLTNRDLSDTSDFCIPFGEGEFEVPGTKIRILVKKIENVGKIHNLSIPTYINLTVRFDIITKDIFWRRQREGDRLLLRGMHRKLRKLYREQEIPLSWQVCMPLLCEGNEVLWAPPAGISDKIRAPQNGESGYLLQIILPQTVPQTLGEKTNDTTNGGI